MEHAAWRHMLPLYLIFVLAFPAAMVWVETRPLNGPTVCLFRQVTRLDCPACGMTRAFRAMGRLDVAAAFRYNPLGPAVFLGAVASWLYAIAMIAVQGRVRMPAWWSRWQSRVLVWFAIVFLLVGAMRMVYEFWYPPPPPVPLTGHEWWLPPYF